MQSVLVWEPLVTDQILYSKETLLHSETGSQSIQKYVQSAQVLLESQGP